MHACTHACIHTCMNVGMYVGFTYVDPCVHCMYRVGSLAEVAPSTGTVAHRVESEHVAYDFATSVEWTVPENRQRNGLFSDYPYH